MSRLRRMQRLNVYRELRRNKRNPYKQLKITSPIACRYPEQRQRLKQLEENLAAYRMKSEHTLIEHVKTVNDMLQEITHKGHVLNYEEKSSYRMKCFRLTEIDEDFWSKSNDECDMMNGKSLSYETLVYLFLEDNTWKNLNKTSKLALSPNLMTSKGYSSSFPWLKKMVKSIMNKENFEQSIPRETSLDLHQQHHSAHSYTCLLQLMRLLDAPVRLECRQLPP